MEAESKAKNTPPPWYLIVNNISKRSNVGPLIRSACAFNVEKILCVGRKKDLQSFGSQGTVKHVEIEYFGSLFEVSSFCKENGIDICGIEIGESSKKVQDHPFRGPTAFLLGNEGYGLMDKEIAMCDSFVYIPHYGSGTASLNVTVAGSIIFHHFGMWANYEERGFTGAKFDVAEIPKKTGPQGAGDLQIQEERKRAKENSVVDVDFSGSIFDADEDDC